MMCIYMCVCVSVCDLEIKKNNKNTKSLVQFRNVLMDACCSAAPTVSVQNVPYGYV